MSKLISFLSQKGGTGKTTLSILTATYLDSTGVGVAVVDADFPQHSFLRTRKKDLLDLAEKPTNKKEETGKEKSVIDSLYPVLSATISEASNALTALRTSEKIDFVFIDVPGTLNVSDMVELVSKLDLIIVPAELEYKSITAALETMAIIRQINPTIPLGLIWTKVKKQHKSAERQAYEDYFLEKQGCYIFQYMLVETVKVSQLLNTLTPQPDVIKSFIEEMGQFLLRQENTTLKLV